MQAQAQHGSDEQGTRAPCGVQFLSFGLSYLTVPVKREGDAIDLSGVRYDTGRQLSVIDGRHLHEALPPPVLGTQYNSDGQTVIDLDYD